jgi:hypothetical protein
MKYVSIDIETTGLDPEKDQILEFGAVIDDTLRPDVPIEELPTFRMLVGHDRITGEPEAITMNAGLIAEIAKTPMSRDGKTGCCHASRLAANFAVFLINNGFQVNIGGQYEYVVAGKNFGVFDRAFLDRVGHWNGIHRTKRRTLDPAILYFDPLTDDAPPSLNECLKRAGFDSVVKHTAVDDALDVVRVLRHKWRKA